MALLLGLSLTSLSACEDPVDNGDEDDPPLTSDEEEEPLALGAF